MKQTDLFEFSEKRDDPIYMELEKLMNGTPSVEISTYIITKNSFDLFEIENKEVHDCVSSIDQCYQYLYTNLKQKG
ncbi:hypothetical protein [Halobacillus seohaensis]|uniref:YozE SAM-like domain-containing protein n=1 Tax=Halobacillus seohaensis TaxID=447421 RepID=A0ABW2EDR9_9BACI